jgi:nitroreductase
MSGARRANGSMRSRLWAPMRESRSSRRRPWLIAIFSVPHHVNADGARVKHYYATESVGIATGVLVTALHHAGLATLTHTPSPMGFLNSMLARPKHEKPFLLLVVGHPAEGAQVPDIHRKPLTEVSSFV